MKDVAFFKHKDDFRAWLAQHHGTAAELWVGFFKKHTGQVGMTYPESVDQALCFGWIDGVRNSVDADSYCNRFTPRKPSSNWSAVNTRRVQELIDAGLMQPPGLAAFQARDPAKANQYSFEREHAAFDAALEKRFRASKAAWSFFQAQPPGYRRTITWWVMSAKRPDTRERRIDRLIEDSAAGRRTGEPARRPSGA